MYQTKNQTLEHLDIIEKVLGPQDWINNLIDFPKNNRNVCLCLDACTTNTAIKRKTFSIPTLDSIIDEMHSSKVFAKLDMRETYTQIGLEEESRKITNFNTDDGVYHQKRLVHGNDNAFEIFQRALEQNMGKIKGVKLIGDDIILYAQNEG